MKTNLLVFLLLCLFILPSCNDDNRVPDFVSTATLTVFEDKYPLAKDVEWKMLDNYVVVDFEQNQVDMEAWFDNNGVWYMTEIDVPFILIPDVIQGSFSQSQYATWRVDDVDMIERNTLDTVYVLEVEQGNKELDLYYSLNGILIDVKTGNRDKGYMDLLPV
ncbi:MAG: PepSY-like domain-containing protein [Parabacteroides sp.]|nr:PepSY-like domain-containing protein [Parabacteroides sp.]